MNETDKIKALREETGLSFNEIKKALDANDGDSDKARESLKSVGAAMAEKKAERQVKFGVVESYIHVNKKVGAMVQVMCETDFVAKNEIFLELAKDLAMHLAAMKPADAEELSGQSYIKDPSITVKDRINQSIARLGENIQIGSFTILEV